MLVFGKNIDRQPFWKRSNDDQRAIDNSKTTFNRRDQAVLIRNYSGAETSTVFQETVVSYDGHGRVKTQHLPQQDANKATIFAKIESYSSLGLGLEGLQPQTENSKGVGTEERYNRDHLSNSFGQCTLDGVYIPCEMAYRNSEATAQCPNNNCGTRDGRNEKGDYVLTQPFRAFADGRGGFIPIGGRYVGEGRWTMSPISSGRQAPTLKNRQGQKRPDNLPDVGMDEEGGMLEQDTRVTWQQLAKIHKELVKILTPECRTVIAKLFAKTEELTKGNKSDEDKAFSSDPLVLFGYVVSQKGFWFDTNFNNYSTGYGAVGKGNAKVVLRSTLSSPAATHALASDVLSELLHVAGYRDAQYYRGAFSDVNLSKALHSLELGLTKFQVPIVGSPALKDFPLSQYPGDDPKIDPNNDKWLKWSRYFHDSMKPYCK